MISPERLIELLAARYRWGLHPLKLFVALLVPIAMVWVADRRLRRLVEADAQQKPPARRLPRVRRR